MRRLFVAAALAAVLLAGCSRDGNRTVEKLPSMEEQIARIENNPNMPPQAKAIAISQIRARHGAGQPAAAEPR